MCKECGCNKIAVSKVNEKLTGKPTKGNNEYSGVGGSPIKKQGK